MILARLQREVGTAPLIVIPLFGAPCGAFSPGSFDHFIWSPAIRCRVTLESRAPEQALDASGQLRIPRDSLGILFQFPACALPGGHLFAKCPSRVGLPF